MQHGKWNKTIYALFVYDQKTGSSSRVKERVHKVKTHKWEGKYCKPNDNLPVESFQLQSLNLVVSSMLKKRQPPSQPTKKKVNRNDSYEI